VAALLPGNQHLQATVSKVRGRWRIASLTLEAGQPAATSAESSASATVTSEEAVGGRVISPGLNVRRGPGIDQPVVDVLEQYQTVPILNRDPTSGWLQIQLPSGQIGWITGSATFVQLIDTRGLALGSARPPQNGAQTGTLVFQTNSGGDIYLINADGTGLRRLTHGLDPVLSPDGRRVAFVRWAPDYRLYTINVDGTGEQAWQSANQIKWPAWSADGNRLTFSFQDGGQLQTVETCKPLVTIDEDGDVQPVHIPERAIDIEVDVANNEVCYKVPPDAFWWLGEVSLVTGEYRALAGGRYSYGPSGHPIDPNLLVYSGGAGLAVLDVINDTAQPLTHDRDDRTPVISPNGQRIAVSYKQTDHWEIHTVNIHGRDRRRLTETPLAAIVAGGRAWNNAAPVWSPDATQIAFLTDRTGRWEIWLMNVDGSHQRPMFPSGALDGLRLEYNGVDEHVLSWR
jgi:hypothetical protein